MLRKIKGILGIVETAQKIQGNGRCIKDQD